MNTRKFEDEGARTLERGSRFIAAIGWPAIAAGAFLALAVEVVLMLFGLAVSRTASSSPGEGFALWALIVQIAAIGGGAALAAALTHPERRGAGMAACGVMVWAVTIVFGALLHGAMSAQRLGAGGAWTAFFAAVLALGAAVVGGRFGAGVHSPRSITEHPDLTAHPGTL